ncbi:hypothetical protein [Microbacterium pumilum]|uniref:Uncharacterized protein n=1 Tax=Microbacterium pumilum TaxID=344165 RepID=A0ABN2RXU0_9MICO
MTFHIGQQNAGVINNTEGDQIIHGGQRGTFVSADPSQALAALRAALGEVALPSGTAEAVSSDLDQAAAAIQQAEPDKERAAGPLERVTQTLKSTGALAAAGAALIAPLQVLGQWLGPLGAGLLKLLPFI